MKTPKLKSLEFGLISSAAARQIFGKEFSEKLAAQAFQKIPRKLVQTQVESTSIPTALSLKPMLGFVPPSGTQNPILGMVKVTCPELDHPQFAS